MNSPISGRFGQCRHTRRLLAGEFDAAGARPSMVSFLPVLLTIQFMCRAKYDIGCASDHLYRRADPLLKSGASNESVPLQPAAPIVAAHANG